MDNDEIRSGEATDGQAPGAGISRRDLPRNGAMTDGDEGAAARSGKSMETNTDTHTDSDTATDLELAARPMPWEVYELTARGAAELMDWPPVCPTRRCRRARTCAGEICLRTVLWRDRPPTEIEVPACAACAPDDAFATYYSRWDDLRIRCWTLFDAAACAPVTQPELEQPALDLSD